MAERLVDCAWCQQSIWDGVPFVEVRDYRTIDGIREMRVIARYHVNCSTIAVVRKDGRK